MPKRRQQRQEGGSVDLGGVPDAPFLSQWGTQVSGAALPTTDEEEGVSASAGWNPDTGRPKINYVPGMQNPNTPFELGHHEPGHAGVQWFWGDPRKTANFEQKLQDRYGGLSQHGYNTEDWEEIRQRVADLDWLNAHPRHYPTEIEQAQMTLNDYGVTPEVMASAREYNQWLNQMARTEMWRASPGAGGPTAPRRRGGRVSIGRAVGGRARKRADRR